MDSNEFALSEILALLTELKKIDKTILMSGDSKKLFEDIAIIKTEINNIKELIGNHVAPYIYNSKHFQKGITPIYYSGPYWDNLEIEAAINSFLSTVCKRRTNC